MTIMLFEPISPERTLSPDELTCDRRDKETMRDGKACRETDLAFSRLEQVRATLSF